MQVRFWGTRGSIPTPGHRTVIFGGNTSCVELRTRDGTTLVFDCGTGIRVLGMDMLRRPGPHRIHLLIGHTHWDHIQGFPFFTPAFLPGTELNIYGSAAFQRSLEDSLSGQMQYSYFPVKLQDLASRIHYTELEGMDELYDLRLDPYEMRNLIADPAVREILESLRADLQRLKQ